jgi:hypothetical protein
MTSQPEPDTSQTPLQQSLQQAEATTRFIERLLAERAAEAEVGQ